MAISQANADVIKKGIQALFVKAPKVEAANEQTSSIQITFPDALDRADLLGLADLIKQTEDSVVVELKRSGAKQTLCFS